MPIYQYRCRKCICFSYYFKHVISSSCNTLFCLTIILSWTVTLKKNSFRIIYFLTFSAVHSVRGIKCSGSRCGDCLVNEGCTWCKDKVPAFNITYVIVLGVLIFIVNNKMIQYIHHFLQIIHNFMICYFNDILRDLYAMIWWIVMKH